MTLSFFVSRPLADAIYNETDPKKTSTFAALAEHLLSLVPEAILRRPKQPYRAPIHRAFFNDALPRVREPQVKALFEELRGEEIHHQRLVLAELEKTPPDPALTAEDFEDEPVAQ